MFLGYLLGVFPLPIWLCALSHDFTLFQVLNAILDSLGVTHTAYENDDFFAIWNAKLSRDHRARIEKTYERGRFAYPRKIMGVINGWWYCCYKQAALRRLGHPLDDEWRYPAKKMISFSIKRQLSYEIKKNTILKNTFVLLYTNSKKVSGVQTLA